MTFCVGFKVYVQVVFGSLILLLDVLRMDLLYFGVADMIKYMGSYKVWDGWELGATRSEEVYLAWQKLITLCNTWERVCSCYRLRSIDSLDCSWALRNSPSSFSMRHRKNTPGSASRHSKYKPKHWNCNSSIAFCSTLEAPPHEPWYLRRKIEQHHDSCEIHPPICHLLIESEGGSGENSGEDGMPLTLLILHILTLRCILQALPLWHYGRKWCGTCSLSTCIYVHIQFSSKLRRLLPRSGSLTQRFNRGKAYWLRCVCRQAGRRSRMNAEVVQRLG